MNSSQSADLVPSVSIANMVNQRAAVMERITAAAALLREAGQIAGAAHLGMPRIVVSTGLGRGYNSERSLTEAHLMPDKAGQTYRVDAAQKDSTDEYIRLGVDSAAWQYLMHESGMRSLMDAKARQKWDEAIHRGEVPELTEANIRATFGALHNSRGEIFERGVIACFRALSWEYKTNLPQKFGKRIVMAYLTGSGSHQKADQLDDLLRVFHLLDGKPEPDHRQGVYSLMMAAKLNGWPSRAGEVENDYLRIKTFKNHNGHITFKRLDLVDKMNLIIAKHYPGALPAPK